MTAVTGTMKHHFLLLLLIPLLLAACDPAPLSVLHPLENGFGLDLGPWVTLSGTDPYRLCVSWLSCCRERSWLALSIDSTALTQTLEAQNDGVLHHACVPLEPGQTLFYRPQSGRAPFGDTVFSVRAPDPDQSLRLVILGDVQPVDPVTVASATLLFDRVREEAPDWVVQCGDIVQNGDEAVSWSRLLLLLPRMADSTPLALVPGNHDLRHDDGVTWTAGFPQDFVDGLDRRHRVLRVGGARFFLLDAFYGPLSGKDLSWLERELYEAREAGHWRFVFLHGAILSSGMEGSDRDLQRQLIPLFDRTRVHAVFYGHDHMFEHYEVTYGPWMFSPDHEPDGRPIHYFLTGGGGAKLEHEYGIIDRSTTIANQILHHRETGESRTFKFRRQAWNPSRVNELADPAWSPRGLAYYHDCSQDCYQEDSAFWGQRYGENVLHYLTLELDEREAVVTARYPDGSVMSGPDGQNPQTWRIPRE